MAEKFRLSLDLAQLNYCIKVLESNDSDPVMSDSCLRILRKTLLKATVGLLTPHYAAESLEEKLGIIPAASSSSKQAAYEKLAKYGAAVCTPEERKLALDYMFENDLMTPEQEEQYAANLMSPKDSTS